MFFLRILFGMMMILQKKIFLVPLPPECLLLFELYYYLLCCGKCHLEFLIGLGILILFLHQLIKFLAALSGSQSVCKLSDELPKTVQNVLGDSLDFNKYVVPPKCHAPLMNV